MRHRISVRCRLLGVVAASCVLAAACTSGTGSGGGSSAGGAARGTATVQPGLVNVAQSQPKPVSGGTLQFSLYTPLLGLDPASDYSTAVTSGIPMAAIYGVLMRYDPKSGKFEPKLAKSLSHDDDFTTWTLTLRPGVEFSDGTPLNAKAVVAHFKRLVRIGKVATAQITGNLVGSYATPDAYTVVFHLSKPWSRFPFVLATSGGMIPSPAAVRKEGETFGPHPVGAGPFIVQKFAPNEELVLVRNPDYWGGHVYLDKLRFTYIAGDAAIADRFQTGEVQMGVMTNPKTVMSMIKDGALGYLAYNYMSGWVPNDRKGHPTADVRVRKAIAYAMNLKELNQRSTNGTGPFHRTLFPKFSRWDTGVQGLSYQPKKARDLVKEVKQGTGWDGSLSVISQRTNSMFWQEAVTLKGELEAVGFQVTLKGVRNINQLIRTVFVQRNYDLAYWNQSTWGAAPWVSLYSSFRTAAHRYGYASPALDRLLAKLRAAPTDQARRKVIADIQRLWTKDQPLILDKSTPNYIFWGKRVYQVVPTAQGCVLLDDAFLS